MTELETIACISRVVIFGDERAFEKIVRAYEQPLRLFLLQQTDGDTELTDDLAQETFIRAWQQLTTFRRASQFKTWLFSIAYHLYLDDYRTRQAHPTIDLALLALEDEPVAHDDDDTDLQQWVQRAMTQLPEPARTVLSLALMQDMTGKQISRITGLSESNVRQIIFRYRPKLKQILTQTRDENNH